MSRCSKIVLLIGIFVAWLALLLSPFGKVVAGVTIVGLVLLLYVCGCVNVK